MAPAPAAPSRRGFSISNPGPKEYLIVGGGAVLLYVVWKWWSNRNSATSAAAASPSSGNAPGTPTGLNTAGLSAFFQDFQSSTTTGTTSKTTTVPDVVGARAATAVLALQDRGLKASLSRGTPKGKVGTITGQNPKAGATVNTGSTVHLTNRVT